MVAAVSALDVFTHTVALCAKLETIPGCHLDNVGAKRTTSCMKRVKIMICVTESDYKDTSVTRVGAPNPCSSFFWTVDGKAMSCFHRKCDFELGKYLPWQRLHGNVVQSLTLGWASDRLVGGTIPILPAVEACGWVLLAQVPKVPGIIIIN